MTSEDISMAYWRLGYYIGAWAGLAIFGTAFVTQLLSIFGIAVGLNMMVWGYGVGLAGGIMSLVVAIMWWMQWMAGYSIIKTSADANGSLDTEAGYAQSMVDSIEWDSLAQMAADTGMLLTVWDYGESWAMAQWMALPEEERMEMAKEHEKKEGMKEGEKKASKMLLHSLFGI